MANTLNYAVIETDIRKPDNDEREYLAIRLENELEVLLISDPKTDKSSAALDVHVGHLSDPDDVAGLAHFCEHLLFMGTEKYPEESEYRKVVDNCKEREMLAVDSEHKKNLQSDTWRGYQLLKDLSSHSHPFRKFGTGKQSSNTGNLETLRDVPIKKGLDVRQVLLEFHDIYYSSNIMKLVILGRETISELTELAIKMFSEIKNKKIEAPSFPSHPYTS
ncbi:Insulinase (Peptidase M16), partial [Boothiomyces sp. JEL0866]